MVQILAALRKCRPLLIWLDRDMTWHVPHGGSHGRAAMFSEATFQVCLTTKFLIKLPLWQTPGLMDSLLKMANLDGALPDYTTLC